MRRSASVLALSVAFALASCATSVSADGPSDAQTSAPGRASSASSPAPMPAPAKILPASIDFTLANGMRVFLVPDHEVPVVSFEVRLAGGSIEDPAGKEGATSLLGALLTKGAGDRNAEQFQEDVEFVGGALGAFAGPRWVSVRAEFLEGDSDLALELLGDVLLRPRLDAAEFEKEKGLALDGLAAAREEPQQLMGYYWAHWVFGKHEYARPVTGDEGSLASITLADVKSAAARQLAPQRAWLAVAGDFDPAEMRKRVESRFGAWTGSAPAPAKVSAWRGSPGGGVLLVDKEDALQTYFQCGNLGFPRTDPDYVARTVANAVLGERFTSRLNKTLRTDKGFTYGAGSRFDDGRQGMFFVYSQGTATDMTAACLPLAESIYRTFVAGGLTPDEFASTRAYIKGRFGLGFETGAQQASTILDLAFEGDPRDMVDGYLARVDAVTLEEVNRVVRERFPTKLDWVVIGRASVCRDVVSKFGEVTECKVMTPGFGPSR